MTHDGKESASSAPEGGFRGRPRAEQVSPAPLPKSKPIPDQPATPTSRSRPGQERGRRDRPDLVGEFYLRETTSAPCAPTDRPTGALGPPTRTPALGAGLGKRRALPVKLELSFGAPIPSTAGSNGGEKEGEKRESTIGINHGELPARSRRDARSPGPTPRRWLRAVGRVRAGPKRSAAAPPSGA